MSSLNELAYSTLLKMRPHLSDDENLDIREVKEEYHRQRALWIRNDLNKNHTIDDNITQEIACAELEFVDAGDCCDIDLGCDVLRTTIKIPNFVELHKDPAITRIGPVDKLSIKYTLVPFSRIPYVGNGRYNRNTIYAFLLNGYIYLYSKNGLYKYIERVSIRGVFENPQDLHSIVSECTGDVCYSDDDEYPINKWMIPYIEAEVMKKFIPSLNQPVDQSNNAKSDIQPISQ